MAVLFAKREATNVVEIVSLGTIKELIGKGGDIGFLTTNVVNPNKRLIVVLIKADGTQSQITCSEAVSKAFRAKEITKNHLMGFDVMECTNDGGETFNIVRMPNTAKLITFKADDIKVETLAAIDVTNVTLEDLLARV